MEEIKSAGNVILVIDEVHTLIGAGAAEGAIGLGVVVWSECPRERRLVLLVCWMLL